MYSQSRCVRNMRVVSVAWVEENELVIERSSAPMREYLDEHCPVQSFGHWEIGCVDS